MADGGIRTRATDAEWTFEAISQTLISNPQ